MALLGMDKEKSESKQENLLINTCRTNIYLAKPACLRAMFSNIFSVHFLSGFVTTSGMCTPPRLKPQNFVTYPIP
ncbi:hypothetical protein Csa_008148 [Cucumis sativus]|nr:hypothetical protein Csa_008148 [Cucumis sativus]